MDPEQGPQDQSPEQGAQPGVPRRNAQPAAISAAVLAAPQYSQQYRCHLSVRRATTRSRTRSRARRSRRRSRRRGRAWMRSIAAIPSVSSRSRLLVIWLGVTLLLQNAGVIDDSDHGWAIFFWGGGVIILASAVFRLISTPVSSAGCWRLRLGRHLAGGRIRSLVRQVGSDRTDRDHRHRRGDTRRKARSPALAEHWCVGQVRLGASSGHA